MAFYQPTMHVSNIAKTRHVDSFAQSKLVLQQNRHDYWCIQLSSAEVKSSNLALRAAAEANGTSGRIWLQCIGLQAVHARVPGQAHRNEKTRPSKKRFHGHNVSMDHGAAASKVAGLLLADI